MGDKGRDTETNSKECTQKQVLHKAFRLLRHYLIICNVTGKLISLPITTLMEKGGVAASLFLIVGEPLFLLGSVSSLSYHIHCSGVYLFFKIICIFSYVYVQVHVLSPGTFGSQRHWLPLKSEL